MDRHEWSMMGADCVVLSCCCPCLLLQILVFVFVKIPINVFINVFRRIKMCMKRKYGKGRRMVLEQCVAAVTGRRRVAVERFRRAESGGCMEEVEEVLGEMCRKGEFGFGSFWKGDDQDGDLGLEGDFRICFVNQQLGYHDHVGKFHFIQIFGPLIMRLV